MSFHENLFRGLDLYRFFLAVSMTYGSDEMHIRNLPVDQK